MIMLLPRRYRGLPQSLPSRQSLMMRRGKLSWLFFLPPNPPASTLSKSKDRRSPSRKCSTSKAEKSKSVAKENAEKRQKCTTPASMLLRHDGVESVYNDANASAPFSQRLHLPVIVYRLLIIMPRVGYMPTCLCAALR